jgi:dipeptidyl aminopeptidase/acylaminoacyl peptidase
MVLVPVLLAASTLTVLAWPGPDPATARPTLPDEFANRSLLTAEVKDRPAGRAIALYTIDSEDAGTQKVVAGADGDTYRQISDGRPFWSFLLSPDGTQVIRSVADGDLEIVDLRTGGTSVRHAFGWVPDDENTPLPRTVGSLLAWSPDGRYVAYVVAVHNTSGQSTDVVANELAIIDVIADRADHFPDLPDVTAAAFAPDGRRLALSTKSGGLFVSVDGSQLGTWQDPNDDDYPSSTIKWSPDGDTLALSMHVRDCCGDTTAISPLRKCSWASTVTVFVDTATGRLATPKPPTPCLSPLGWRSPTTLIGRQDNSGSDKWLVEFSTTDGSITPISHFRDTLICMDCTLLTVQLATNLLADAGIRTTLYPDRGPWTLIVNLVGASLVLTLVGSVLVEIGREMRANRRARREPPDETSPASEEAVGHSG